MYIAFGVLPYSADVYWVRAFAGMTAGWEHSRGPRAADALPGPAQAGEADGHVVDRGGIVDAAGQPLLGGVGKDGPADGKALDDRCVGTGGERRLELVLGRLQAEEDDAAAPGIGG